MAIRYFSHNPKTGQVVYDGKLGELLMLFYIKKSIEELRFLKYFEINIKHIRESVSEKTHAMARIIL